jgi:hypothetical protein
LNAGRVLIAAAFLKNHMPLGQISNGGTFSGRGQPYKGPRGIYVPSIFAKDFVPDGVVLRTPGFSIAPLDMFALWSRGNVDPLVHRILSLLKEIKREL